MFSLFRRFFLVMIIHSPLPPLLSVSALQNTPFLGFFGVFPSHAYIYHRFGFLSTDVVSFWWCFLCLDNTERISPLFLPPVVPGVAAVGYRSRSFSRLSPPVSDGLSAKQNGACCFYSSDTGGRVGGTATLGVKGRREGGREGKRSWVVVFVGVRDCPETGSVLCRQSICRGQWRSMFLFLSQIVIIVTISGGNQLTTFTQVL